MSAGNPDRKANVYVVFFLMIIKSLQGSFLGGSVTLCPTPLQIDFYIGK